MMYEKISLYLKKNVKRKIINVKLYMIFNVKFNDI